MFTNITIGPKPTPAEIPEQGFYVILDWMYGDADGDATKRHGPIPAQRTDLAVELANVLEAMVLLYEGGKGGWDDYESVPGAADWFSDNYETQTTGPDQDIREQAGLEIEYTPDDYGCEAKLTGFTFVYYDGVNPNPHPVTLT